MWQVLRASVILLLFLVDMLLVVNNNDVAYYNESRHNFYCLVVQVDYWLIFVHLVYITVPKYN